MIADDCFRVGDDTPGIVLAVGNRPRSNGGLALSTGCAFIPRVYPKVGSTGSQISTVRPGLQQGAVGDAGSLVILADGRLYKRQCARHPRHEGRIPPLQPLYNPKAADLQNRSALPACPRDMEKPHSYKTTRRCLAFVAPGGTCPGLPGAGQKHAALKRGATLTRAGRTPCASPRGLTTVGIGQRHS